jgi:DNA modification methylase
MPSIQFKGKSVIERYHHTVPHHRLEFDAKLSLLPKGEKPSLSGNLIIEGDNLLALKALLPTHAGKIKCIYIDPPYNTGEEEWVFNDNLTQPQFKEWIGETVGKEGEDATRHDKWCCMMYPRLMLLKELLNDEGSLFVSIDDNEAGTLRFLLDEIFRVDKPLATFVWKRRSATGMRGDPVSVDHEYVYLYAKDPTRVSLTGLLRSEADYPLEDQGRRFASTDLTIGMTEEDRPNQAFTIQNPRTGKKYPHNPDRVWRFEPEAMKTVIKQNLVIWPDEQPGEMERPRYKTYFDPKQPKIKPVSSWIESTAASAQNSEEDEDLVTISSGLNSEGGRILKRILGEKRFSYPKPPSLLRSLIRIATSADDIVLDSFAGSGTTAQAVLDLNAADKQRRKFILVQLKHDTKEQEKEEFNVCARVAAARVRNLMTGYTYTTNEGKKVKVDGVGGSFNYSRIGDPLFGEYRDLGQKLPKFEDLAKYIFYTETSRECDLKQIDEKTGFIGSTEAAGGTSYYLFYTPNNKEDRELSTKTLDVLLKKDKNRTWVIYCEKIWLHADTLRKFEKDTGKRVRPMLVPFNLK